MPTLESYKLPQHQTQRLRDAGFEHANTLTVERIWENWVSTEEKERVDRLEGLDEVEEWKLLADHYVVAWDGEALGLHWTTQTGRREVSYVTRNSCAASTSLRKYGYIGNQTISRENQQLEN